MTNVQQSHGWVTAIVAAILTMLAMAIAAPAQTFEVLYTFTGGADGAYPNSGLVLDSAGNLYGAGEQGGLRTSYCSPNGCGTLFKVDSETGEETTLFEFNGADGSEPFVQSLWIDQAANLYGTTVFGGDLSCGDVGFSGCGTAFKLAPDGKATVLYQFTGGADGKYPYSGLILDAAGHLFGAASSGGAAACLIESGGCGTVFSLRGHGIEYTLYSFTGGTDGAIPADGLLEDSAGNLYGTTNDGGNTSCDFPYGCGVVFKLDKAGKETVLHTFIGGSDGAFPSSGLIRDVNGNLFGATQRGGAYDNGTLFRVAKTGAETVLYSFTGGTDGAYPLGNLLLDANGNLYGTAVFGGEYNAGTVFRLDRAGHETVLHAFTGLSDGVHPESGLIMDSAGVLYGTTSYGGGVNGTESGTVFLIKQ